MTHLKNNSHPTPCSQKGPAEGVQAHLQHAALVVQFLSRTAAVPPSSSPGLSPDCADPHSAPQLPPHQQPQVGLPCLSPFPSDTLVSSQHLGINGIKNLEIIPLLRDG